MLSTLSFQLFLLFCALLLALCFLLRKKRPPNYPPGPLPLPFIGNLHQIGFEPHKAFMKMGKTYGAIFSVQMGGLSAVVLNDTKTIKEALAIEVFAGRPYVRPFDERNGRKSRGVIFSERKVWVEQRRFLLKTLRDFGFGKKSMECLIQDEICEFFDSIKNEVGVAMNMRTRLNGPAFNCLWTIISGSRVSYEDPDFRKVVHNMTEGMVGAGTTGACLFFPTLSKIFPGLTGYNTFFSLANGGYGIVKDTLEKHKETYDGGHMRDLVDVFIREIKKTEDTSSSFFGLEGEENLKIGLMDLFVAGLETTSTTLGWTLFILSQKSEEQEKLFEEIRCVVGLSRLPSLLDREKMPYTEALLMEVFRFSSMTPLGLFHNTTEDVQFQGFFIPKDTMIITNLYGSHMDERNWEDPGEFRPSRFLSVGSSGEVNVNRHHENYIPFSTGKRICLGEALAKDVLFLFITSFFQKFKVCPDESKPLPRLMEAVTTFVASPPPHTLVIQNRVVN